MVKLFPEAITIPPNENDEDEVILRKKLGGHSKWGDFIIRWYRNAKKGGEDRDDLRDEFLTNFDNIKDLLRTYESHIEKLKSLKIENEPIEFEVSGKTLKFHPIKDIQKIRRLEGFELFVQKIGDKISETGLEFDVKKMALDPEDRKRIKLLGSEGDYELWQLEEYSTTNKFVFHLWQNIRTLGRGDVYGDPSVQTPYCTHSKQHWDSYAKGCNPYRQYWVLMAGGCSASGDLMDKTVASHFMELKGRGAEVLICMNDTNNDLLDRNDRKVRMSQVPSQARILMNRFLLVCDDYEFDSEDGVVYSFDDPDALYGMKDEMCEYGFGMDSEYLAGRGRYVKVGENGFEGSIPRFVLNTEDADAGFISMGTNAYYSKSEDDVMFGFPSDMRFVQDWFASSHGETDFSTLTELSVGPSIENVGRFSFEDLVNLKTVHFGDSVTEIQDSAFHHCGLEGDLWIPSNVNDIGKTAFHDNPELSAVHIPETNLKEGCTVHASAFGYCDKLKYVDFRGVGYLCVNVFNKCHELKTILFSDIIDFASPDVFYGIPEDTKLVFPESIKMRILDRSVIKPLKDSQVIFMREVSWPS
jgi:hypothetical protein